MANVLLKSIYFFLNLLEFLIFARCIMSWLFRLGSTNCFSSLIYELTEFLLVPVRNLLNKLGIRTMFIDLSPLVLGFIIEILKRFIVRIFLFSLIGL